jgi:hypothetical protein
MPHRLIETLIQNQKIVTIQMTSTVTETARLMQQCNIGVITFVYSRKGVTRKPPYLARCT